MGDSLTQQEAGGFFSGIFGDLGLRDADLLFYAFFLPNRKKQLELIWFQGLVMWHFVAKFGWFFSPTVSDFQGNLTEKTSIIDGSCGA